MDERPALAEDSIGAISRIPGGPTNRQVEQWTKMGYLRPVRKGLPGRGYYGSYNEQERFVAVVMARLMRVNVPSKLAAPIARKAWAHRIGQHKVRLDVGVYLHFTTKADGTP